MRISRKKKPKKPLIPKFRLNEQIREPEVRVIDAEGNNVGVLSIQEALRLAEEQELDLVEINPKASPPVTQLTDFTHFKYQKEKEARKQKANAHVSEIKGIRLSIRIGTGDMETRRKQAEKFLERGDKVKMEIILKGAERGKVHLAFEVLDEFYKLVNQTFPVKYEQAAEKQGNKVTAIITRQ